MRCSSHSPSLAAVTAVAVALSFGMPQLQACTTGVVSGKFTGDGRPLLWKNRDTKGQNNQVVHVPAKDGKYGYTAVIGAGGGSSVWMGVNEKGFCIENSVIRDMPGGSQTGAGNGEFMRIALEKCANVAEFEALLEKTNETGRKTMANYGVIDAEGGAMLFETGHKTFVKFDANDPETAPNGYVVRSNFTMTGTGFDKLKEGGDLNDIYSGGRYLRADALFNQAAKDRTIDFRYILRHCSRDMADEKCLPLPGSINGPTAKLPELIDTQSTVCRKTTVSVAVFQGVRPGEDPRLTTMWVMLGEPAFAVAVPCWVKAAGVAEPLHGGNRSPICNSAIAIKNSQYDEEGNLRSENLPAIWAKTWALEDKLFQETQAKLNAWHKKAPTADEVLAFHESAAKRVASLMKAMEKQYAQPAVETSTKP